MKKTFLELKNFNAAFTTFCRQKKENEKTKLGRCGISLNDSISPEISKYNKELSACYLDFALTDKETGAVLEDPTNKREFKFAKDQYKLMLAKEEEIVENWDKTEIEFKPVYCSDIPKDLGEELTEAFTGFIIEPKK